MASTTKVHMRKFRWSDFEEFTHLYNEIWDIANSEKAFDQEFMREYLSQPTCDPVQHCYLAEIENEIVGFVLLDNETPIRRAVASGGVREPHRNRGIGRGLVKKAVEHAHELNALVLHIETAADDSTAQHLLESEDFQQVKRYWQMRWEGGEVPPPKLPNGFEVRPFVLDQDEAVLTELQNIAFGENWGFSPNTVEQISQRVRMKLSDPDGILFILDGDRPAAYNWTLRASNENYSTGWISMTGVHPDYRGSGLGKAVVTSGIQYLREQNVDAIELEVDSANPPARELYLKLGFEVVGQTVWYERRLD